MIALNFNVHALKLLAEKGLSEQSFMLGLTWRNVVMYQKSSEWAKEMINFAALAITPKYVNAVILESTFYAIYYVYVIHTDK